METSTIKETLQRDFVQRCKKNNKYSLRAYAHYLEIDQSLLSKLINGRRKISFAVAQKLSAKIGMAPKKDKDLFAENETRQFNFIDLKEDEYEIISTWYHFAILELIKTKGFQSDPSKVARQLGLHANEVKDAVARLQRVGFIKVIEKKWTLVTKNHTWAKNDFTTNLRRHLQIELGKKSIAALENVPFSRREHGSLTVAIDSRKLPDFKKKLSGMLAELSEHLQPDQKNLDSVYQVLISLFPLSTVSIEEKTHESN